MKHFTIKNVIHKIMLIMLIIVTINFKMPTKSFAANWEEIPGSILKEIVQFVDVLGDIVMGGFNNFMLGADGFGSAMLEKDDNNLVEGSGSWLVTGKQSEVRKVNKIEDDYKTPNMLYSPENIFGNKIAALDINFLRSNTYSAITNSNEAREASESGSTNLALIIASWYKAFRNIAAVGLLSVLVYLGIRILISTAATDKAKYKESLKDWLVALCLIFVIHFLMSGILMISDKVVDLFSDSSNSIYTVNVNNQTDNNGELKTFNTNLVGFVRLQAQSTSAQTATAFSIIYLVLVIYTCIFTFMYFKRFLWIAFLTMIAPLVALTYPIDKAGDSKAQAFSMWLKEYIMNVILQPVHLILYTTLVSLAYDLAAKNPIYAIVAIGFLIPAEKFIKEMFGLNKASTTENAGTFAQHALALKGLQSLGKAFSGKGKKDSADAIGDGSGDTSQDSDKIKFAKRGGGNAFAAFGADNKANPLGIGGEDTDAEDKPPKLDAMDEEKKSLKERIEKYEEEHPDAYNDAFDPNDQYAKDVARYQEIEAQQKQAKAADEGKPKQIQTNSRTPRKGYMGRLAGRAGKKAIKALPKALSKGLKLTGKIAGAGVGATIGLASGIASGNIENAFQNMAVGGIAGSAIGKGIGGIPERVATGGVSAYKSVASSIDNLEDTINQEKYGYSAAKDMKTERQNRRAREAFVKNETEIAKYRDIAGKIGYTGNIEDLMNSAADYKEAGVNDDEMIENALKAEQKYGNDHKKMVDVASFAAKEGITKSDITQKDSRESLENTIASLVPESNRYEVGQHIADLFGSSTSAVYKKSSKFKKR